MDPYINYFNFLQKIFVFVLLVVTCTESLISHDEECLALYLFKQSFPRAPYETHGFRKFDSWKTASNASYDGSDCCLWDGVMCNDEEEGGHVIGLNLSESALYGHINSSSTIFNLVHLQMLNLAMNNFTKSQIPSQISHLKQLRSLNLSYSGFSGQIPNEIAHLKQLSSLDLSYNLLTLHSPSLEQLVQNLTGLEELHLSRVDISSSIPYLLANFSSLSSIKLEYCFLQNEFPTSIFQLPKLKHLEVGGNTNLTGFLPEFQNNSLLEHLIIYSTSFSGFIPNSIKNLNHLSILVLRYCSFSGYIPSSFANMTQLNILHLGANEFNGVVPSLASLTELTVLNLEYNKFEKECLPNWLGKLTKLTELYMNRMTLYGKIQPFLANLTKLSFLGMGENSLIGHIPSSFMNLTQLSEIDLCENQLEGPISDSFSNFYGLQNLRLARNNFSGRVDLKMFLGLNKLKVLDFNDNGISLVDTKNYTNVTLPQLAIVGFSLCNLTKFPAFLRFQHEMTRLSLAYNRIEGIVPEWIWNNNQETLEWLDLSYNKITGFHQHQRFLPWFNLEAFLIAQNRFQGLLPIPPPTILVYDVSRNNFKGEIPSLLMCEMKSLRRLVLAYNKITGTIPRCVGSISNSLMVLDLKGNKLNGTIMNSFTQGSALVRIDLSENQFMGQLPRSLINCTSLEVFSIGDNCFNDSFPFWLGTLVKLKVLILRSNKFYGTIQGLATIRSPFPELRIIDISNNGFGGQLSRKYFETWRAMKSVSSGKSTIMQMRFPLLQEEFWEAYSMIVTARGFKSEFVRIWNIFAFIDISCNNFEGQIPQSLEDLHGLRSLNLSHNNFTGHILSSMGNLINLESLDLSQNKLSGEIPQQLLQLGFLAVLNVSFNDLEGRIPQGKQFDTFENISYVGNLGLCGKPLSKECESSKAPTPLQTSDKSAYFLPSDRVDWIVILCGIGSGLIVGIINGNFLYARYSDWFTEEFDTRKDKWTRSLSKIWN